MLEKYSKSLRELVKRECFWQFKNIKSANNKKIIIFTAGPTAQNFYFILKNELDMDVEFFIDNNEELENKYICGKIVKSLKSALSNNEINGEGYLVLIPTSLKFYNQILTQLDDAGVHSYILASAFLVHKLWERFDKISKLLEDEVSKATYWGAIYSLITGNNNFIMHEPMPTYFGIKDFTLFDSDSAEIIVDAGAYIGDTTEEYVKRSFGSAKVYAFEPFTELIKKLEQRKRRLCEEYAIDDNSIEIVPAGVGIQTETKRFYSIALGMLRENENGDIILPIYSLDDYFSNKAPFTLLKADVEGAEIGMLKGAKDIIRKNKPKLSLSIYHNLFDFVSMAEYIYSLVPDYRFYVRSHSYDYRDTVLYCII